MVNEIRTLIYYLIYAWILGYVFSTESESYFIYYIRIPDWLNRVLFIFRANKPVNIIAIAWQINFVLISITLLLLLRMGIIQELSSALKIFKYMFSSLFLIALLLIGFDKFLYYRHRGL